MQMVLNFTGKAKELFYGRTDEEFVEKLPQFFRPELELNVTDATMMFYQCRTLVSVPLFDTSKVTKMYNILNDCSALTSIPPFDTSKVTDFTGAFRDCKKITSVPDLDTSSATTTAVMFYGCSSLTSIPGLDLRNVTNAANMLASCKSLTNIAIKNIKTNLSISGSTKLTSDSLIHICRELRDTGSVNTLTMASESLTALSTTYVKLIDITDEMRSEDDLIDEKLPFEICESTDEGAMLITDYVILKNWSIKT
jgi:surface protein